MKSKIQTYKKNDNKKPLKQNKKHDMAIEVWTLTKTKHEILT
jgi:hypothetical protein